ncbi:hypothetical protein NDU88_006636 [Pleurodeles waltl]|uniref:Uncharacterized protein n=1 Tax=Pleurodeles waltl TaxID=8319 RepID=A0AAV7N7V3_PLEWA|nr:hypothetical protein NDU88_006636 [Pleurodeles waltl]
MRLASRLSLFTARAWCRVTRLDNCVLGCLDNASPIAAGITRGLRHVAVFIYCSGLVTGNAQLPQLALHAACLAAVFYYSWRPRLRNAFKRHRIFFDELTLLLCN